MRALALVALLLPQPVMADQILASSKIISVTLYPEGAQVTRDITFTAPAGPHDLLIADLPSGIVPDLIRLASPDLQLGAFSLRNDRLPPRDEATNPALVAAKAGVEAATLQLATAQAAIDAINARVESAEAQTAFLKGIKAEGGNLTVEALQGIAQMVGTQTLTGANTYSGPTIISAGTLQIGDGSTTGSLASSAITNRAVTVKSSAN